jgi:hypothetical protein
VTPFGGGGGGGVSNHIYPTNHGRLGHHQQSAMLEPSTLSSSQIEWYDTEDILALLTANDSSWLQSLPELHPSPFGDSSTEGTEYIEESRLEVAASIDCGHQAMQQVKQSLRDLVSPIFHTLMIPH